MVSDGVVFRVEIPVEIVVSLGTFLVNSVSALVMFGSGASHSFVSTRGGKIVDDRADVVPDVFRGSVGGFRREFSYRSNPDC